jgi:two-component system, LytTR family, sensor kinase
MVLALGVLLGIGLAAIVIAAWRVARARRSEGLPQAAMQAALHAAISTLPHLRRGLTARTAERAVPHLRALTGAAAVALADTSAVLAIDGEGREQVRPGDQLSSLLRSSDDDRVHFVPRLVSSDPSCPLKAAVLAPLIVQGKRAGTLIVFYRAMGRPSHHELRVLLEAASLVSAQVELSVLAEQEERLAQAELRALRAQISPHFIYNALAAVAGDIHARPEEARELLIDFAEFTRYLFREQARFRGSLHVSIDVPAQTRSAVVPAMSVQPLVENAVRHGVERRAGSGRLSVSARVVGSDVELSVTDDGVGIDPARIPAVLAGAGGGIGLSNVDARLRATFGERYALRIEAEPAGGTRALMAVPNLRGSVGERELVVAQ